MSLRVTLLAGQGNLIYCNSLKSEDYFVASLLAMTGYMTFYETITIDDQ